MFESSYKDQINKIKPVTILQPKSAQSINIALGLQEVIKRNASKIASVSSEGQMGCIMGA